MNKADTDAHARRTPSKHENAFGVLVRVAVTKPVSFRVGRLRKLLKTKGLLTLTLYFLINAPCQNGSREP
jgi:hypothetical protein